MRIAAALAVGVLLAGAATAAEAPTIVDLVVVARLTDIDLAPRDLIHPDDGGIRAHSGTWLFDAEVEQVLGGDYPYRTVRVVTRRESWRPVGGHATIYWLKRERGQLYRLVCDQAVLTGGPRPLKPDWRSHPDCNPPGERFHEPGG